MRRAVQGPFGAAKGCAGMKKPKWVIEKEKARRTDGARSVWLFGLHAVRDALLNPAREKLRLVVTKNAAQKLGDAIAAAEITPEIADPRKFPVPLDPGSVHQGAALEVKPLDWGTLQERCLAREGEAARVLLLDRVSDPHNVGAILRSAEVFGARAVIAPQRHSAPETGALAKAASGALERQPYLRVRNLAAAIGELKDGKPCGGRACRRRAPARLRARSRGAGPARKDAGLLRSAGADPRCGRFRLAQRVQRFTKSGYTPFTPPYVRGSQGTEHPCFISLSLVP